MDIIALLIFLGVILLGFFRKTNVGILALAASIIAVRLLGLTEKDVLAAVSSSMFTTLVGITLLFGAINATGALQLTAEKIVVASGKKVWLIPIAVYIAGFVVAGIGPGAIPALAIIPALAVPIAYTVGYDPVMLAIIGECGLMAGRMTPITPEGQLITGVAESVGITNVMPAILAIQTLITGVFAVLLFFIYKGHKLKEPKELLDKANIAKFNVKQLTSLAGIPVMLVLIIFFNVNVGLAAFGVAALLLLFDVADEGQCIKSIPWGTVIMVLGVGALMAIVDKAGGITLMSNALSSIMNNTTAAPIMGVSAGLMSMVSSALGVVYPTMMPMSVEIAANLGAVSPVLLMSAVAVGGSLMGISPLSTGGALAMAAIGNYKKDWPKEEQNKVFIKLFAMTGMALVVIVIIMLTLAGPIVNLLHS